MTIRVACVSRRTLWDRGRVDRALNTLYSEALSAALTAKDEHSRVAAARLARDLGAHLAEGRSRNSQIQRDKRTLGALIRAVFDEKLDLPEERRNGDRRNGDRRRRDRRRA